MTTSPVVTITDESVAELEKKCLFREESAFCKDVMNGTILALLSERADLKRDAERYRFIRDNDSSPIYCREIEFYNGNPCGSHNVKDGQLDAAIDQAMQERK